MANNEVKNEINDELRISWFGMDGMLCLLYSIEVVTIGWSIVHNVDFVLGRLVPYGTILLSSLVFLKYIYQVF